MNPRTPRHIGGFTLIELIIVIIAIGVLASALVPLATSSVKAYQTTEKRLLAQDRLRYAMERMSRELREVSYVISTGFAFTNLSTTNPAAQLVFAREYFDNNGISSGAVTITLANTAGKLTLLDSRYTALGAQTLCDNLASLQFNLLDENGLVLTSPTRLNVYAVEIVVQLDANGAGLAQSTKVELKNRTRI